MGNGDAHDENRLIAGAVRDAARVEPASAQARARVRAAVHAQWRATLGQDAAVPAAVPAAAPLLRAPASVSALPVPAARRARWPLALAASVVVAVVSASLLWQSRDEVGASVAVAELVRGPVQIESPGLLGERRAVLAARGAVAARQHVATGADGAALLRFGAGLTLRLAANSRLELGAPGEVKLEAGTAYIDADPRFGAQPLTVTTALGSVRHLGTRYSVSAGGRRLEVAVREGRVQVSDSPARAVLQARAGEALAVESSGAVARLPVNPDDPRWNWLASVPLPFELDGASLSGFLDWYSRETGMDVSFADAAGAARAGGVTLSGSIAGLAPDEALRVVAASSGLAASRTGSQVVLTFR